MPERRCTLIFYERTTFPRKKNTWTDKNSLLRLKIQCCFGTSDTITDEFGTSMSFFSRDSPLIRFFIYLTHQVFSLHSRMSSWQVFAFQASTPRAIIYGQWDVAWGYGEKGSTVVVHRKQPGLAKICTRVWQSEGTIPLYTQKSM